MNRRIRPKKPDNRKLSRRVLGVCGYLIYVIAVVFFPLEFYVRHHIIPRNFEYILVQPGEFPFFKLVSSYNSDGITIRNSRRESLLRGARPISAAFIGDSVTFGAGVSDKESYVELIQQQQRVVDAYNYGVPGYGLPEIKAVLDDISGKKRFSWIVYTYNLNDVYPAMAGYLSLMTDSSNRFDTIDAYDGLIGFFRAIVKDHVKSVTVCRMFSMSATDIPVSKSAYCYQNVLTDSQGRSYQRSYAAWGKMYSNKKLQERLEYSLASLKKEAEASGAKFLVVIHYDFLMMDRSNLPVRQNLISVLQKANVEYIDPYSTYREHFRECNFYSDPYHPGKTGYQYLSQSVTDLICKRSVIQE